MRVLGITRVEPPTANLHPDQPRIWTFIGFETDDSDAQILAETLSRVLDVEPVPWYCNYSTAEEMWVVFPERIFRYRLDDPDARSEAEDYARACGLPAPQLDW